VRLADVFHSTTVRWALAVAGAFGVCTVLLFSFVYWQTAMYVTSNVDEIVRANSRFDPNLTRTQALHFVAEHLEDDPRRVKLAELFTQDGAPIAGNVASLPPRLPLDEAPRPVGLVRVDNRGREVQSARVVARRLASGDILLVGHDMGDLRQVAPVVARALMLGLLPAVCLALITGAWLTRRAQRRIDAMNRQVQRVMAGDLNERLPVRDYDDPLNRLAKIVNTMLDQIERLVGELASVGDDIAHDLRTPLTRVRAMLERGRDSARTLPELTTATERAISGLDQSLSIITALLRIAEIDHGRRNAGMAKVQLAEVLQAVHELYQPIAEDKGVSLRLDVHDAQTVAGDHDLLLEAVANLVDNAVKFTPARGSVALRLLQRPDGPAVRVEDTGPGIIDAEREAVFTRFYRSDKSRHAVGVGLGLSLVAAIVKLHGFSLRILDGPGCRIEIACHAA
jgi:signal transduction histidine kinase